jgi:hypothetical protein
VQYDKHIYSVTDFRTIDLYLQYLSVNASEIPEITRKLFCKYAYFTGRLPACRDCKIKSELSDKFWNTAIFMDSK